MVMNLFSREGQSGTTISCKWELKYMNEGYWLLTPFPIIRETLKNAGAVVIT